MRPGLVLVVEVWRRGLIWQREMQAGSCTGRVKSCEMCVQPSSAESALGGVGWCRYGEAGVRRDAPVPEHQWEKVRESC
jgi:hypothetical protein